MSDHSKKFQAFKTEAGKVVYKMENLINTMPHKGDKCADSQKVCLTVALKNLESFINGTGTEDFMEGDE